MNIAVIGTGYVGLVNGACLADFGHTVTCVDTDRARIERLTLGDVPFFEPGLAEVVERNVVAGRLRFTTDTSIAVRDATVIFVAVGTPEAENGEADLSQIMAAAEQISVNLTDYKVIVTKSTVPAGTGARLSQALAAGASGVDFDVVSNPEFLREGAAVQDFMRPDRIVIGTTSERAAAIMREIYRPLYLIETPVIMTNIETAEMIKYASNAFLAIKISFINEVANLCERVGADVHTVAKGMGLDNRIGPKFLHPGPGYGGSCFPKDTRALAALGGRFGARQRLVESAIATNERQRETVLEKLHNALGTLIQRQVAILGLSFKPNTSDVRESPALYLCRRLMALGAKVRAFDPVACQEAATALGETARSVHFATDVIDAVAKSDVLVIMTEWNEFRSLDLAALGPLMRRRIVIDTKNVLDVAHARAAGFTYIGTGRGTPAAEWCADFGSRTDAIRA
jgi:UDPglucose 6-dehydrogenase